MVEVDRGRQGGREGPFVVWVKFCTFFAPLQGVPKGGHVRIPPQKEVGVAEAAKMLTTSDSTSSIPRLAFRGRGGKVVGLDDLLGSSVAQFEIFGF